MNFRFCSSFTLSTEVPTDGMNTDLKMLHKSSKELHSLLQQVRKNEH